MRLVALVSVVLVAGMLVSGCVKRAGLLADQQGPRSSAPAAPEPRWRVAEGVSTTPSSVLRDVVALDATHAWAVGHDSYDPDHSDTTGTPIALSWDGVAWSRMTLPVTWHGALSLVATERPDDVWAVGGRAGSDPGKTETHLLRYDGTAWSEVPFTSGPGTTITDLAVADGHAWLVGYRGSTVVVQEWDGSGWRAHRPPAECTQEGTSFGGLPTFCNFTGVTAFAADDVWVAGNAAWPGFKGPLLFHWDGSRWRPVQVGVTNADTAFSEIAGKPGDIWAVGHTAGYGGPVAAHGDGTTWRMVDGLPAARYTDLAMDADGDPWVLANLPSPAATLLTYRDGHWAATDAPRPPDTTGTSLFGITAIPGTPDMFAVGDADLPGTPVTLRSVLLEYRR